MAWTEDTLLKFMQVHSDFFGKEIKKIEGASKEWIIEKFQKTLFRKMCQIDFYEVVLSKYADITYEGKGDIKSIKPNASYSLSEKQCVEIANFIAGRTEHLSTLDVFAIIQYLEFGEYLQTTGYMQLLRQVVKDRRKGGQVI